MRKAPKLNRITLVIDPAACLLDLSNNFAEKKINLSEWRARLPCTYRNYSVACFVKVTLKCRGSDRILCFVTFHQRSGWPGLSVVSPVFPPWGWCVRGASTDHVTGPGPGLERPFLCELEHGFTLYRLQTQAAKELPFERKGKELYSQDGYLVTKRGLLNFTFFKKKEVTK